MRSPDSRQLSLFGSPTGPGPADVPAPTEALAPEDGPGPPDPPAMAGPGVPMDGLAEPPDAAERAHAVDPAEHVVLEASAGTGKTSVLVRRYCNLLAAGVDPANILAITFTRKAAAEMRERIVRELRREGMRSAAGRRQWLELRDRIGDIAISTIDAFCLSLLREFPLEADLDPGFRVADDTEVSRITHRAIDHALRVGRGIAAGDAAVALVLTEMSTRQLRAGLLHLLDRRSVAMPALAGFLARSDAPASAAAAVDVALEGVRQALAGVPGGAAAFLDSGPIASPRYRLLRRDVGDALGGRLNDVADRRRALEHLVEYFLTQKGEPRTKLAAPKRQFATAAAFRFHKSAFAGLVPAVAAQLDRFDHHVNAVLARGVQRLAAVARQEYLRALEDEDVLDFTETLERAVRLLEQMDEFSRSRYRLESRYHHVLVDEFQDTSRLQWRLVSLLIEAWRAGEGASADAPLPPSVFVVGDRKQSIYRFRDAEVAILDEASRHIAALRPGARPHRAITTSFRSPAALLAFVNDLFDAIEKAPGRSDGFRYDERDRFPVLDHAPADGPGGDIALGLAVGRTAPDTAARVAGEIVRLVSSGLPVRDRDTGVRRPVQPGDVAILFRSRESHREYEAALAARGVPTYVYKGLGFFGADEIQDLTSLIRFLAQPGSPSREAAFLRSRFVRLSDAALVEVSADLGRVLSAHEAPRSTGRLEADDRVVLARARAAAQAWLGVADRVPPSDLLDAVVRDTAYAYELRGPRYAQARENVKKFRALLRRIQNRGYATLGRIADHLDRLSAGDESNAAVDAVNAVNLMTVHAAKGLEFPVTFVVNLTRGTGTSGPPVRVVTDSGDGHPAVSIGTLRFEADEEEERRDREETKRLLYVALTRARDRLYLAGTLSTDGHWAAAAGSLAEVLPKAFSAVLEGAADGPQTIEWCGRERVHRFLRCGPSTAASTGLPLQDVRPAVDLLDRVADRPLLATSTVRHLVQSVSEPVRERWDEDGIGDALAGRLVHRLFQAVDPASTASSGSAPRQPALATPAKDAEGAAGEQDRELRRVARSLVLDEERAVVPDLDAVLDAACSTWRALRDRADVQALFEGARANYEVPFSLLLDGPGGPAAAASAVRPGAGDAIAQEQQAEWGGEASPRAGAGPGGTRGTVVRGAIDCLLARPDGSLVVVEIKTGRQAAWHSHQLALYVRAAQALVPGARVSGVLLTPERSLALE